MSNKKLLAMYNAAAAILGKKALKKFANSTAAHSRTDQILTELDAKKKQFYRSPATEPHYRKGSLGLLMSTAMDNDMGIEEKVLVRAVEKFYANRSPQFDDPMKKLRWVLNHLARTKGMGFQRIGTRYWLVTV